MECWPYRVNFELIVFARNEILKQIHFNFPKNFVTCRHCLSFVSGHVIARSGSSMFVSGKVTLVISSVPVLSVTSRAN